MGMFLPTNFQVFLWDYITFCQFTNPYLMEQN